MLTVIALTIISPLVLDMTPEGSFAATLLFVATGVSVLASMLVLRHLDNRILALHMLLLAPVMAGIVGSMSATAFWGCLVLLIWVVIMALERIGIQFTQIIAPQNYNIAITIAYAAIGVALYPHHGENQQTIEEHADQAMYAAKHSTGAMALGAVN